MAVCAEIAWHAVQLQTPISIATPTMNEDGVTNERIHSPQASVCFSDGNDDHKIVQSVSSRHSMPTAVCHDSVSPLRTPTIDYW